MEAFYCDIPSVQTKNSQSKVADLIVAILIATVLVFMIKSEFVIHPQKDSLDENN